MPVIDGYDLVNAVYESDCDVYDVWSVCVCLRERERQLWRQLCFYEHPFLSLLSIVRVTRVCCTCVREASIETSMAVCNWCCLSHIAAMGLM